MLLYALAARDPITPGIYHYIRKYIKDAAKYIQYILSSEAFNTRTKPLYYRHIERELMSVGRSLWIEALFLLVGLLLGLLQAFQSLGQSLALNNPTLLLILVVHEVVSDRCLVTRPV